MRASAIVLGATVLLVLAGCGSSRSASSGPKSYYLALGDSIAYGQQPTKPPGAGASAFDTGYVDAFAASLKKFSPDLKVVNYGCSGESTVTFTQGGCPAFEAGFKLHDTFGGPQLRAAESFLKAHDGEVSPITLTLWGNDFLPLVLDTCNGDDTGCVREEGPRMIASIGTRLRSILKRLRAAAPNATIIVTGAWNPDPGHLTELEPIYRSLNAAIIRAASASGAKVANARWVFNPPASPLTLCKFTFICSMSDPHPTDAGYRALAAAFMRASGYAQK